ncbi:MAG: HAD family hydrolase [Planctomycetota bacterium]|nr:HAD family hydrolase [Planctomycetota bacterium]
MPKRIQGILFDLGDTLLDFGAIDVPALFQAGAKLAHDQLQAWGLPVPRFARYHRKQLWAIRWSYFKSYLTGREFSALDLIGRLHEEMNYKLTLEQVHELAWLWYRPLRDVATIEPGLAATLESFRRDGLVLGAVSNTFVPGQVLDRHLREEGLLDLLPVRVYSCDVGHRKPDKAIFQIAAKRTALPPAATLFVGDLLTTDIRGSHRAGMISVLKDPLDKYVGGRIRPHHRIARIADLRRIVDGYNGVSST